MLMCFGALFVFNVFTFFMMKLSQGGVFVYNKSKFPHHNARALLIAGLFSQPDKDFGKVEIQYGVRVDLNYSLLGFNPKNAGKQLEELAQSDDCLFGVSIGCKAILYSHRDDVKRVLINPATHTISLDAKYQTILKYSFILVTLSYLLGWISALPIIPTKKGSYYSLALLSDQLYWLYYGDPKYGEIKSCEKTSVIMSSDDKLVVNLVAGSIYKNEGAEIKEIKAGHADMIKHHTNYDVAIKQILAKC